MKQQQEDFIDMAYSGKFVHTLEDEQLLEYCDEHPDVVVNVCSPSC